MIVYLERSKIKNKIDEFESTCRSDAQNQLHPILATSGKEAFGLFCNSNIDLIITDLRMPELNDMEFSMNVRQFSQYNHIQIVAVTADVERTRNFDMRYFTDTLIKPVSLAILQENGFS